jgi:hypothetical protein
MEARRLLREDFELAPFYEGIFSITENITIPGINQIARIGLATFKKRRSRPNSSLCLRQGFLWPKI